MQNPILVAKMANALDYASLKICRSLNSLWYEEVSRVLKKKSVILVSPDTIPEIMNNDPNSTDIFCKAVRMNTSFSLGDTTWLFNFLPLYTKELEFIEWTDSGATCHHPDKEEYGILGQRQFLVMAEWNCELPKLTQLILKPTFAFGNNLTLILKSAPNLKILRVDFVPFDDYCMNEFMTALQAQTDLSKLKTLEFGENTYLSGMNVQMLIGLPNLELEEFIMEGRIQQNSWLFKTILERWSETLETVVFRTIQPFKLTKIMPRLKNLTAGNLRLMNTLPINIQFPSLEYFHANFNSSFKFDRFIPPDMEPHENMREFCYMGEDLSPSEFTNIEKMFDKFPNLTSLSIPTTDVDIETIYTSCPNLKTLNIRGTFTDVGVTGINNRVLDNFYKILMSSGNIVGEDFIEDCGVRKYKSILDLKHLETLSLWSESVGDKSVLWGILPCTNLKKLYLPRNVTDKSLDALMSMKELRELTISPPHQGHISFDAIKNFSAHMIHVQLNCRTDDRVVAEGGPMLQGPMPLPPQVPEGPDDEGYSHN